LLCYYRKGNNISGDLHDLYTKFSFKIDKSKNEGKPDEPYSVINGVSNYVDDRGVVHPEDEKVVIYMKRL